MVKGLTLVTGVVLVVITAGAASAQRPRTVPQDKTEVTTNVPPPPAPQTFNAKYEGGVFGYNKKMEGTLTFDDANQRLVFKNDKQKEILFITYNALTGAY